MKLSLFLLAVLGPAFCSFTNAQSQLGQPIDGTKASENFGTSVSVSGNRVAIGAVDHQVGSVIAGLVQVHELRGDRWVQLGQDLNGVDDSGEYGSSVSLRGDRLAVGEPYGNSAGLESGRVRVYDLVAGTWRQVGQDIDGAAAADELGSRVSLSGALLAVGAPGADTAGQVKIFEFVEGTWRQIGATINGEVRGDNSGSALSLDGNRLAIGARDNEGNGLTSGHTRVFELRAGAWVQLGGDIDGESAGDRSGYSVSLDGDRVAIGAIGNADAGILAGHVRVYQYVNGAWVQLGQDLDGEAAGDRSGYSVSLQGDRLAVGAIQNAGNGSKSGHVRLYQLINSTWVQIGRDIDGAAPGDLNGRSVDLDGRLLAVGAAQSNASAGQVRVYDLGGLTSVRREVPAWAVNLRLYPNPLSAGTIQVAGVPAGEEPYFFRVVDALGRMQGEGWVSNTPALPELTLAAGVYQVIVTDAAGRSAARMLVVTRSK